MRNTQKRHERDKRDNKRVQCTHSDKEHGQRWPENGFINLSRNELEDHLKEVKDSKEIRVHLYVVTSLRKVKGKTLGWEQHGSGPNFEGGVLTLCTCKHYMRSWHDPDYWKKSWIAGFTSVNIFGSRPDKRNYLFYLTKIKDVYDSFFEIWHHMDQSIRNIKNASLNPLGDLYEPREDCTEAEKFNPDKYKKPCDVHDHSEEDLWKRDINRVYKNNRRPRLFVGDPDLTFLWNKPMIYLKNRTIDRPTLKLSFWEFWEALAQMS